MSYLYSIRIRLIKEITIRLEKQIIFVQHGAGGIFIYIKFQSNLTETEIYAIKSHSLYYNAIPVKEKVLTILSK